MSGRLQKSMALMRIKMIAHSNDLQLLKNARVQLGGQSMLFCLTTSALMLRSANGSIDFIKIFSNTQTSKSKSKSNATSVIRMFLSDHYH